VNDLPTASANNAEQIYRERTKSAIVPLGFRIRAEGRADKREAVEVRRFALRIEISTPAFHNVATPDLKNFLPATKPFGNNTHLYRMI
jgi:hypothetical protein